MENRLYDKNRRPIYPGDVLKVYHFTGARRKKHYMYKLAIEEMGYFYGIDICHLATKNLDTAHRYGLRPREGIVLHDTEIIAGYGGVTGFGHDFMNRKKLK